MQIAVSLHMPVSVCTGWRLRAPSACGDPLQRALQICSPCLCPAFAPFGVFAGSFCWQKRGDGTLSSRVIRVLVNSSVA